MRIQSPGLAASTADWIVVKCTYVADAFCVTTRTVGGGLDEHALAARPTSRAERFMMGAHLTRFVRCRTRNRVATPAACYEATWPPAKSSVSRRGARPRSARC